MTRVKEDKYGPEFWLIALYPCATCGAGHTVPHHVRSVGAGGTDRGNLVPLCLKCHNECETGGRDSFEAKHNVDLSILAEEYEAKSREEPIIKILHDSGILK